MELAENKQSESKPSRALVPLPSNLIPAQLSTYNHVDAIPFWTIEKCLDALQDSVTKQKAIQSSTTTKPAKIRKAVAQRLKELIQSQQDSLSTQQLVTDVVNAQAYLIDQIIPILTQQQQQQHSGLEMHPLHLPPLQGHAPDKMTQLNQRLTQVNYLLRQLQHQQQHYCRPVQEEPSVVLPTSKVYRIEPNANHSEKIRESAQRLNAALDAKGTKKPNKSSPNKPHHLTPAAISSPNDNPDDINHDTAPLPL